MSSLTSRRASRVALAAGAIAVAATTFVAAKPFPLADGLSFSYTVTSTSKDKNRREATNMNATVRILDGNVRLDYTDGRGPMGQKNAWMLFMGNSGQFAIVDDKEKKALIIEAGMLGVGAGAMLNNPLIKVTMSDMNFSYTDVGPGEKILGYDTRHVRVVNTSTVEIKIPLMNRKTTTVDTSDQYIATGIDLDVKSLEAWARAFGSGVRSTNPELAASLDRYNEEFGRKGMPLKTITYSTIIDGKGKTTKDTVTMQITGIQKGALDPALFQIPAGYETQTLAKPPQ